METSQKGQAAVFEAQRPHLTGLAYRMLGSLAEAQDLVQEASL
jgi:RNA polymerase sigma-70 factor (ECF subfamily)